MSYKNYLFVGFALMVVGSLLVASAQATLIPPSGLVVWFDAQDVNGNGSAGPVNGTAVGTWVDKAFGGNNDASNATVSQQPLYYNGVVNGKAVLRFDGGDYLETSGNISYGPFTAFSVFKANSGSLMLYERGSAFDYFLTSTGYTLNCSRTAGSTQKDATTDWGVTGGFLVAETQFNGTIASQKLFSNGGELALTAGGPSDPGTDPILGRLSIGDRVNGGIGLKGDYAELLIFNRLLTADERNGVGSYLAGKYGLTTSYVPEPSTLVLLATGLIGLLAYAWRKRK